MVRIEIYANRSVEENILNEIETSVPEVGYSLFENVQGRGRSGIRKGTAIWPELNVLYVIYCEEAQAIQIARAVKEVKKVFPNEGIRVFQYEARILESE